ncbi:MAG: hypothetical protein ABIN01_19525 [Ferruginibacter sp.]
MKNDKAKSGTDEKKGTPKSNPANKKDKGGVTNSDAAPNPSQRAKARAGRGLTDEGTITSYEDRS